MGAVLKLLRVGEIVKVWAEANERGEIILFAFAYPGACGWGPSWVSAAQKLQQDVLLTEQWMSGHGFCCDRADGDLQVVESVGATGKPRECDSEAFFVWDKEAFEDLMLDESAELLSASRSDLLDLVRGLSDDVIDRRLVDGKRTIREILDHIAIAEWWYTTRIAPDPSVVRSWKDFGQDAFMRLQGIRDMFVNDFSHTLRQMSDVDRCRIFQRNGERWTAKKVLRRAVWHELLHLKQLRRLIPKMIR